MNKDLERLQKRIAKKCVTTLLTGSLKLNNFEDINIIRGVNYSIG